jgi:hypothetical protein
MEALSYWLPGKRTLMYCIHGNFNLVAIKPQHRTELALHAPFYLVNCLANYLPRYQEPQGHTLALAALEDLRHTGCITNGSGTDGFKN